MSVKRTEPALRYWSKVETGGSCWEWRGTRFKSGYGGFQLEGKLRKAHRLMYEWARGPIPEGMLVCHHCDNPGCVKPSHLFLGTHLDNMQDKMAKGRHVSSPGERNGMFGKRKTHCKHGHELIEANVYRHGGQRHCQVCRSERIRAWNARVSAERKARRAS